MAILLMNDRTPGANNMLKSISFSEGMYYDIRIQGVLDEQWSDWFNHSTISTELVDEIIQETHLIACVPDQAKLRAILNKIWDLNLTVIAVNHIAEIHG